MDNKRYIIVDCITDNDGRIIPKSILWTNGKSYIIQRIVHTSIAPNNEFEGICYTVQIGNKQKNIYLLNNEWYLLLSG